jgi:hypothetical protein
LVEQRVLETTKSTAHAKITGSRVSVFTIPTDAPEADGTCSWDSTTMVLVELEAAGKSGSVIPTRMKPPPSW